MLELSALSSPDRLVIRYLRAANSESYYAVFGMYIRNAYSAVCGVNPEYLSNNTNAWRYN
jgi:hypothetical protein